MRENRPLSEMIGNLSSNFELVVYDKTANLEGKIGKGSEERSTLKNKKKEEENNLVDGDYAENREFGSINTKEERVNRNDEENKEFGRINNEEERKIVN